MDDKDLSRELAARTKQFGEMFYSKIVSPERLEAFALETAKLWRIFALRRKSD